MSLPEQERDAAIDAIHREALANWDRLWADEVVFPRTTAQAVLYDMAHKIKAYLRSVPQEQKALPTEGEVTFAAMAIAARYCCSCPEDYDDREIAHQEGCGAPIAVAEMLAGPLRNWGAPPSGQPSLSVPSQSQQEGR